MCVRFELMILKGMCSSDPKGFFTFVFPHDNSFIDYFIVSADLLRNNIDMSVQSSIESWHIPVTLSLNIRNNAVKFIEKIYSEEV